jgi:AraC-like DNA-binding protein
MVDLDPNQLVQVQEIFFSCVEKAQIVREHFIPVHGLAHVFSGEIGIAEGENKYTVGAGETILFRRNQLAKLTKRPVGDTPVKTVSIFFTQSFLKEYYSMHPEHPSAGNAPKQPPNQAENEAHAEPLKIIRFGKSPLFDSLFNSILPYYEFRGLLPEGLITLKLSEAMTILKAVDKRIDGILTEFAEPGKIDLADFMQKNYFFNVSMERFSYLTGRSLATFKRDFQKIFNTSPQKWLLQKRLEQAHYLIMERKQKPSDVYLEVGFENLSHFSSSFKQLFGYNPSSLRVSY